MGLVLDDDTSGTQPRLVLDLARVGPSTGSERNTIGERISPIACVRLDDLRFRFDSSLVSPKASRELGFLDRLRKDTPGMPASVFGHADPVGDDTYNKTLSGRRAEAIYGLLTRRVDLWQDLFDHPSGGDDWGIRAIQSMLTELGFYEGPLHGTMDEPTRAAVRDFQQSPAGAGLTADGDPGPKTRAKLFPAYMDIVCVDENGRPYSLDPARDFLAQGADSGGKGDFQGCSEFNPLIRFSIQEEAEFQKSPDKTERNAENAPNRRVLIYLFRPGLKVAPAKWPCPRAKEGPAGCRKRFFSDGESRRQPRDKRRIYGETRDTFACRFYDRLVAGSPCEKRPLNPSAPAILDLRWSKREVSPDHRDPQGRQIPAGSPTGSFQLVTVVAEEAIVSPLVAVRNLPDGTPATIEVRHCASGALVAQGTVGGLIVKGGKVVDPKTGSPPIWFFNAVHLPWDPFDRPFFFFAVSVGGLRQETPRDFESQPGRCLRVSYWHALTSDAIADAGGLTTQAEMNEIGGILESNLFHRAFRTTFRQRNLPLSDYGDAIRNSYTLHQASHGAALCPIHEVTFRRSNGVPTACPKGAGDPAKSVIAIGPPKKGQIALFGGTEIANAGEVPSVPRYLVYLNICSGGFEAALASTFVTRGTQNAIAFGMEIEDVEARQMARDFYNSWSRVHHCDPSKIADVFMSVSAPHGATMRPRLFGAGGGAAPPAIGPISSAIAGGAASLELI